MSLNLRRRTLVRIISFLAAAIIALGGALLMQQRKLIYERRVNANTYLRAFDQLTSSVDKLDAALEKCIYTTTAPMLSALSSEVYAEALSAQQALGELPYANIQLEQTAALVAKTGDYAAALAKSVAANDGYTGEQQQEVKALHKAASSLKERLHELENRLYDGSAMLEDAAAVTQRLSELTENGDVLAGSSYQEIETEFPELPTLIYDGPFSQHLQSRSAKVLDGTDEVSREEARRIAAQWLGLSENDLADEPDINGEMPCWVFAGSRNDAVFTINVTKQGGAVLSWGNDRAMGAEQLTREEAQQAAERYLEEHGFEGMSASYSMDKGNALTVNFAATQGDVTCYPDLVKVEVAMDTGEVVGFEASGYLMNHAQRTDVTPVLTQEEASQVVSGELKVLSTKLAIVPTEGEYEVLCWEFKCENEDGYHYIVYVNAENGAEQKLFRLVEDESGTLVL